jgi:hypothetical protein
MAVVLSRTLKIVVLGMPLQHERKNGENDQ